MHGDIHDIGKDVVVMMLEVSGYEVHDLGIDVPVESFVAAIKRARQPEVVGLSGLLTLAFDSMKDTVEGIAAAGLRDQVKIMIGGSPVDEQVCTYTGADGWGRDAAAALAMAADWTAGGRADDAVRRLRPREGGKMSTDVRAGPSSPHSASSCSRTRSPCASRTASR